MGFLTLKHMMTTTKKLNRYHSAKEFYEKFLENEIIEATEHFIQSGICKKVEASPRKIKGFLKSQEPIESKEVRSKIFDRHVGLGLHFKYPKCCIINFARMSYQGIPPALYYALTGRGNPPEVEYVMCDKCFENLWKKESIRKI